jgi:hypothetical protein
MSLTKSVVKAIDSAFSDPRLSEFSRVDVSLSGPGLHYCIPVKVKWRTPNVASQAGHVTT